MQMQMQARNQATEAAPTSHRPAKRETQGDSHANLQATIGNQATARLLRAGGPVLQAKLKIGRPGDVFEQEADRVADQVMRMAAPAPSAGSAEIRIQRMCPECEEEMQRKEVIEDPLPESEEQPVSAKEAPGAIPAVGTKFEGRLQGLRSGGAPLPGAVREYFEPRFGRDFSAVRLHTGPAASDLATEASALAFTVGRDIVFGAGQYAPESDTGKRLLAHELTHVVQQGEAGEALMRTPGCNCSTMGRDPTAAEISDASAKYPNLKTGDWCVTGPATPDYNCIAWTIGVTNRWVWDEVDTAGDGDGTVSISDFDAFYANHGYSPTPPNETPADPAIALFADSSGPTHAAIKSSYSCAGGILFESKRGRNIRIAHFPYQLEGGIYGNIVKYYA